MAVPANVVQRMIDKITETEKARLDCISYIESIWTDVIAAHADFVDAYFVANPANPSKAEFLAAIATARSAQGYKIAAAKQSDLSLVRSE